MNDLGFLVEKHSIEIKKSLEKLGKIALEGGKSYSHL